MKNEKIGISKFPVNLEHPLDFQFRKSEKHQQRKLVIKDGDHEGKH